MHFLRLKSKTRHLDHDYKDMIKKEKMKRKNWTDNFRN